MISCSDTWFSASTVDIQPSTPSPGSPGKGDLIDGSVSMNIQTLKILI